MFSKEELLRHYETMVKIRKFELEAKRARESEEILGTSTCMWARRPWPPAYAPAWKRRIISRAPTGATATPSPRARTSSP